MTTSLRDQVIEVIKRVIDPEVGMDLWSMETIEDLEVREEEKEISLKFRPTSPFCPLGAQLAFVLKDTLRKSFPDYKIDVKVTGHLQEDIINKALEKYGEETTGEKAEETTTQ